MESRSLERLGILLKPASTAVIGASSDEKGLGSFAIRNLIDAGYQGRIYPVNPRHERLFDLPCFPDIGSVGEAVDCAIVALPAHAVPDALAAVAAAGVKGAVVFAGGFGEADPVAGREVERRVAAICAESGMRLIGPNTVGVINYRARTPLTFTPDLDMNLVEPGSIGIVSQSAGLATHFAHIRQRGIGMSYMLSVGNSIDVDAADMIGFLAGDDATTVIALIVEGVGDGRRFREAALAAHARGKPIVALKIGRTAFGSEAAQSHTGTLVGEYNVFSAVMADLGIVEVRTFEELVETAVFFAKVPAAPKARGVAIVATTGGFAITAADAADEAGLPLPPPGARTLEELRTFLPSFSAMRNPVDITANVGPEMIGRTLAVFAKDEAFGAIVIGASTTAGPFTAKRPATFVAAAEQAHVPICAVWMSAWNDAPGSELIDASKRMPLFRSTARCLRTIRAWFDWHDFRVGTAVAAEVVPAAPRVRSRIDAWIGAGSATLSEIHSRELLGEVGITSVEGELARDAAHAGNIAEAIGFPVVAKISSAGIAHKSDIGGVILNLGGRRDVEEAFEQLMAVGRSHAGGDALDGVLVTKMLRGGYEMIVGAKRDPVFGPVALCGAGGIFAEILEDTVIIPLPSSRERIEQRLEKLNVARVLKGARGRKAVGLGGLTDMLMRLGELMLADARIVEVDINPVIVTEEGAHAADALVVLDIAVKRAG